MATAKPIYAGAAGTAFTITTASLAAGVAQQATFVNNQSSNLWLDVTVSGYLIVGAAIPTGDCYILGAGYDGTQYPWGGAAALGASNAALTAHRSISGTSLAPLQYGQPVPGTGLVFLATVPTAGVPLSSTIAFGPVGLSQAFQMGGLTLPVGFSVVVVNATGEAFSATTGNLYYNGTQQSIA